MKRGLRIVFCLSLVLILSLSLVSAGWFDWVGKITGHAIPIELSDDFCDDAHLCLEGFKCDKEIQKCVKQVQSSVGCLGISIPCFKLKDITSCKNQQGCSWGTITANAIAIENPLPSSCSGTPKLCGDLNEKTFCENQKGCSWKENCFPDCVDKECGEDGCGESCGECEEGKICFSGACKLDKCLLLGDLDKNGKVDCNDFSFLKNLILQGEYGLCGDLNEDNKLNVLDIVLLGNQLNSEGIFCSEKNIKDSSKYFNDQVFLISDKNWKDVLPLVPLTTWTQQQGDDSECQRGYGTAEGVCVYPTLIYHEEDLKSKISLEDAELSVGIISEDSSAVGIFNKDICSEYWMPKDLYIIQADILESSVKVGDKIHINITVKNCNELNSLNIIDLEINLGKGLQEYFSFYKGGNLGGVVAGGKKSIIVELEFLKPILNAFDIDSSIYFMQQYNAKKVTIVSETPQELDNLLIAEPELGAGINQNQIQRIKPEDYLNYWESYKDVVYVEDNYELGLMASTYVSLLNAPLIIQGTSLDKDINFVGKNIICVGNVNRNCNENYNLDELQKKYVELTNTDKIILVNPNDLHFSVKEISPPEKSVNPVYEIYSKTSLASPILASAKHEVIISTTATDYERVDNFLEEKVDKLIPEIVNNKNGLQRNNYESPTKGIYKKDINTEEVSIIKITDSSYNSISISNGKILFKDYSYYIYDIDKMTFKKIELNTNFYNYDFSQDKIFYGVGFSDPYKKCDLFLYDILTTEKLFIKSYSGSCNNLAMDKNNLVWLENSEGVCYNDESISCNFDENCLKYCSNDNSVCEINDDCGESNWCYQGSCNTKKEIYVKKGKETEKKLTAKFEWINQDFLEVFDENIIFLGKEIGREKSNLYNYNSLLQQTEIINEGKVLFPRIDGDYIIWTEHIYEGENWVAKLYLYNLETKQKIFISNINDNFRYAPKIYKGKILWFDVHRICEITGGSCSYNTDCGSFCSISGKECDKEGNCPLGDYCNYEDCVSIKAYIYDIFSSQTTEIKIPSGAENFLVRDNEIFYTNKEKYDFYISGFLTIFGASDAIPFRDSAWTTGWYDIFRSLDFTQYGDIYLEDRYPDMSVGRIQGITLSDVSSYLGRDLFYNQFNRTNNVQFMASSFDYELRLAHNWTNSFSNSGYNSHCSIFPTDTLFGDNLVCDITNNPGLDWPVLWEKREVISYMDHGSSGWAGISSGEIPYLENSIVYNDACSTCSTYNGESFCNNVIRKGGLGHLGAVSVAFTGNKIYRNTMNGIYKDELTLGESFARAYDSGSYKYMTELLGDPTLDINSDYKLKEELPWNY
ncbi:MAG: hypothetical protein KJ566_02715 [Nanoarchaeota archaeon]|nr:hypothetical protein [Nanoarchaeota archaeon]